MSVRDTWRQAGFQFAKSSDGKQSLDEVTEKMNMVMELEFNHPNIFMRVNQVS